MKRRELIRNIAAGTATVFIVPSVLISCEKDELDPDNGNGDPSDTTLTIDLNDTDFNSLGSEGGFVVVDKKIIVINTGDGYIALSSICTHQGCQVSYDHGSENLPCPCHGSIFSTTGTVLNGPASSNLKRYNVVQEGNILTIDLD
jgi:cytochrome b6-f complex iron-sulfur subunit